ncbi:MAG: ATP synthase F1 subunit delta [Acholeplasmataceae bacterium]|jgi:ATP synthase F1 delta subunit|nr:ATP synthase F1 subunit delta [Acholeplasmataceae bacterium]MDD4193919.1 ATP synthase F1 subunit delta [Acholeplasmataceae bacterium]
MSLEKMTQAFFELVKEEDKIDVISDQFDDFRHQMEQNHEWSKLMDSPMLTLKEKIKMIDQLTYDVHFLSFLKVLAEHHMMHDHQKIYAEWSNLNRLFQKIAYIRVYTAKKLTKVQEDALLKVLQPRFTDKKVMLRVTVDENLIGGMVTVYKGQSLDQSTLRELEELFTTI